MSNIRPVRSPKDFGEARPEMARGRQGWPWARWLWVGLLIGQVACRAESSPSPADGSPNTGDPIPADGQPADSASDVDGDTKGDGFTGDSKPLADFPIRTPESHQIVCVGARAPTTFWDIDHVCQVSDGSFDAEIYVQATPATCSELYGCYLADYAVQAWAKVGDAVFPIPATYDFGGRHHNDSIYFRLQGALYLTWHSSIGFGGRACLPPDCLIPCQAGTTTSTCDPYQGFVTDGCARDSGGPPPPLPGVCVTVLADGTVPKLLDPWVAHDGFPDYPVLPCPGDL